MTVLPQTVTDINDMLTIVFVGAGKFDPKCLANMFTIQKIKVWNFLLWLNAHRLYTDISLDRMTMDIFPENGLLPGVED